MDINTAKEVIACLPEGKTFLNYYKDRYAVFILSQVIENGCSEEHFPGSYTQIKFSY